jgi:hypothetical protein
LSKVVAFAGRNIEDDIDEAFVVLVVPVLAGSICCSPNAYNPVKVVGIAVVVAKANAAADKKAITAFCLGLFDVFFCTGNFIAF